LLSHFSQLLPGMVERSQAQFLADFTRKLERDAERSQRPS
jgi:hypothetical protein